jgi:hypothetical protein
VLLDFKGVEAMLIASDPDLSDYYIFEMVAFAGHVSILNRLLELAPVKVIADMLVAGNFKVIKTAARNEHIEMTKILLAHCSKEVLPQVIQALSDFDFIPDEFKDELDHYYKENSDLRLDIENIRGLIAKGVRKEYFHLLSIANQMITPPFQIQRPITLFAERCLKMGWLDSRQKIVCNALNQGNLLLPPLIGIVVGYIGEKAELFLKFTSSSSTYISTEPIIVISHESGEKLERKEKSWADVVKQDVAKKNPPLSRSSE